jgi:putative transposase
MRSDLFSAALPPGGAERPMALPAENEVRPIFHDDVGPGFGGHRSRNKTQRETIAVTNLRRVVLPGFPHHIVQRGHNRRPIFAAPRDYAQYLEALRELTAEYAVSIHAYCLMTNHVHLLLTPTDTTGLAKVMKPLAGRYTRRQNWLDGRTGTLWESRYRSSLVDTEGYLLACCRYIELNPVRASIVADPTDYVWSSCRYRLGLDNADWLKFDAAYIALADNDEERRRIYRAFVRAAIPEGEWDSIRQAAERGQLTGSERFIDEIARIIGRRVERRGRGRPRKTGRTSILGKTGQTSISDLNSEK